MAESDAWFDRVPGGYYKAKNGSQQARQRYDDSRRGNEYDDRDQDYDDRDYDRRDDRRDSHRTSYDRGGRRHSMGDNYGRRSHDDYRYEDDRYDDRYAKRDQAQRAGPDDGMPIPTPAEAAAGGFAAGVAAAHQERDLAEKKSTTYSGYVPYSDIYGNGEGEEKGAERAFSPLPVSSPQPHSMNQVSPARRTSITQHSPLRNVDHGDGSYDDGQYEDDRYSRPPRPRLSRLRSSSYDSYDSRTPSRYRNDRFDRPSMSGSRYGERSMSRPEKTFDKSKRGLGYGAVGALAGGLLGSEFGGGTSATIGAVLGGLGANMFEARERRKQDPRGDFYVRDEDMTSRRGERRGAETRQRDSSWTE